jgi:hypothetical protein
MPASYCNAILLTPAFLMVGLRLALQPNGNLY